MQHQALPEVANALRDTFALDAVAVLRRADDDWRPDVAAGGPLPARPQETLYAAEVSDGGVLALIANPHDGRDLQSLRSFVNALRNHHERDQLDRLANPASSVIDTR